MPQAEPCGILFNKDDWRDEMLKEVIAVIRPNMWQKTKQALHEEGFTAFTVTMVYGRGKEKGLHYLTAKGKSGITFLPKRMLTILVETEDVNHLVELLMEINRTGEIGDGKIFVCPVDSIESIRTGNGEKEAVA